MRRPNSSDPGSTLRQRAQGLLRHTKIAVAVGLTALCAGVPFVLSLPPLYRASATVLIEGSLPGLGTDRTTYDTINRLEAIKQEALSRSKLLGLVERFDLYPGLRGRVPPEVLLERLHQDIRLDVQNTGETSPVSFTLSYTGLNRDTAAAVANALASFFIERNDMLRTLQSSQTTKYLQEQIAETRKRLDAQSSRVKEFAAANTGAMPQQLLASIAAIDRYNDRLQQIGDERLKLAERRQVLQASLADLSTRAPDPLLDPVGSTLATKRNELTKLVASGATDMHPDVRILRNEIAGLEKQQSSRAAPAGGGSGSQRATYEQQLKEVTGRLNDLEGERAGIIGSIRAQESRVAGAAIREPDVLQLNREYAATRDSLDLLQKQYDQARLTERASTGERAEAFRIVDPAVAPGGSVGPNRNRLLFALLLLAAALAVGTALLADRLDTSFGSVDELRAFTRVPVLASIPQISTWRDTRSRWVKGLAAGAGAAVVLVVVAAAAAHFARGNELIARLLLRVG